MTPTLRTARLLLRPLEAADAEQAQALFPRWEIVRYLAAVVPWPYPADGAVTYFRDVALPAVERGEAWHWSLRLHEDPQQLVGLINLHRGEQDNRGFWIGLPWQRRGLATEACAAVDASRSGPPLVCGEFPYAGQDRFVRRVLDFRRSS